MRALCWVVGFTLAGCASHVEKPDPGAEALAQILSGFPASQEQLATTSADIYLGNLEGHIAALEREIAQHDDPAKRAALAGAVYQRFRIEGRLVDDERALELIDGAVRDRPGAADAHQFRASVLSSLHRFAEAARELDRARELGAREAAIADARREIDLALGRYDRLREEIAASALPSGNFYELAFRANLRVQLGDAIGASFLFRAAQSAYEDVNPVPIAWLYVQQGIALLRYERCADAVRFFEAARARIPTYYLATEHLAECEAKLGHPGRARSVYREVIVQTGNPEYIGALARIEHDARLEAQAAAAYTALLERHHDAYAQHAAEFYLAAGRPREALPLARENVALRQDVMSELLLARVAAASGAHAEACDARSRVLATPLRPPEIAQLTERCDPL